jgi:hypothetical protein
METMWTYPPPPRPAYCYMDVFFRTSENSKWSGRQRLTLQQVLTLSFSKHGYSKLNAADTSTLFPPDIDFSGPPTSTSFIEALTDRLLT